MMLTSVRKVGNSAGITLPAPLLKSSGFSLGDQVDLEFSEGVIIIKKVAPTPKYTLEALLSQCDLNCEEDDSLIMTWNDTQPVGKEAW